MARFSSIAKGARSIKPTRFWTLDGKEVLCGLKLLDGLDEATAIARAKVFAKMRGGDGVDGDPLYELGKAAHLVEIACTDPDDPTGGTSLFDEGVEQILKGLDTESIFLLKERQRAHQEETNPSQAGRTLEEYVKAMYDSAAAEAGAELPFESWPLLAQRNFVRSMARQLVSLLALKSQDGSLSEANTAESKH